MSVQVSGPTACLASTELLKRMKRVLFWCSIGLVITASFYAGMWFQFQLEVDKCLDRGGAWRKEISACVGAKIEE
jgi:hypothetical protein